MRKQTLRSISQPLSSIWPNQSFAKQLVQPGCYNQPKRLCTFSKVDLCYRDEVLALLDCLLTAVCYSKVVFCLALGFGLDHEVQLATPVLVALPWVHSMVR